MTSLYVSDGPNTIQQSSMVPGRPGLVQSMPAAPAPEVVTPPVVTAAAPAETKAGASLPIREVATRAQAKRPVPRKPAVDDSRGSGSYVEAASNTRNPLPGADNPVVKPEEVKGTPAGEVLKRIGVEALFGESGWKANNVSPNTAAAKAGVQAGDIIESVDDQEMTDLGSVAKPAKGKKLKVKRDGKSVEIVID